MSQSRSLPARRRGSGLRTLAFNQRHFRPTGEFPESCEGWAYCCVAREIDDLELEAVFVARPPD
jgi:hypothetical protein